MIDYSKWKQATKAATTLQLDQRNPRLLPRATSATQPELVAEMIKHEDVYGMAKSIVERGFFPHELIIGIEEQGRMTIVEGNRRVCAVKLLISPTLAPADERARFKKLSHKANIAQIRRLPVLIAPSRDAAAPLIQSRHTRSEIEKWSPVMQARFYADRLADGNTVDELAAEFTIPPGQIREFVQNYQMYCVACSLDLPPGVADKVKDPREFPLSSLERIYRNADSAAFLGISFDEKGSLKGTVPVAEFKKAFGKVVSDVALGKANSRKLNTKKQFADYLGGFGDAAPDSSKKGSFTAKDLLGSAAKATSMPKTVSPPAAKPKPPQKSLVSKSFVCGIGDVKINAVVNELKRISVDDYPNAVALTLRGFLDIVVGDYCDRVGATKSLIEKLDKKAEKPADWFPTVRQILNYFINEENTLALHPLAIKAAKLLVKDESGVTVLMLDAFAHNNRVIPPPAELRSSWAKIEDAVKAMLTPPNPPSSA
jgi:hypothetical protein